MVALLVLGSITACGSTPTAGCPAPVAATDVSSLPDDLNLTSYGVVVRVQQVSGFLSVGVVSARSVSDLAADLVVDVEKAGYTVLRQDSEGIEADLYLSRGDRETGAIRVYQTSCQQQVGIDITLSRVRGN